MSNANWVCFDCRQIVRRPDFPSTEVRCSRCGQRCRWLGRKIPIPARNRIAAWAELRRTLAAQASSRALTLERETTRRKHDLERRLRDLESRPQSPGLAAEIKRLRSKKDP